MHGNEMRAYDLRISPLKDWSKRVIGRVVALRDTTEQKRAEQATRQHLDQLESLRQIELEIAAELDLATVLSSISRRAVKLMGGVTGSFYLYRPELDLIERVSSGGPPRVKSAFTRKRGEGLIGKVWENGKPMFINDYRHWDERNRDYDSDP